MLAERDSDNLTEELITATCVRQNIQPGQLTIHADRGNWMSSEPMAILMANLGMTKTYSRPHISNYNRFSESQFTPYDFAPTLLPKGQDQYQKTRGCLAP